LEIDTIHCCDVFDGLRQLPDNFIDCVVTSPPYWGLRNYGMEGNIWDGKKDCKHEWKEELTERPNQAGGTKSLSGKGKTQPHSVDYGKRISYSQFCSKCGAWKGQLGLEPSPELYVNHLVDVFREVKRVLKKDGTVWLNLGDTYCSSREMGTSDNELGNYGVFIRQKRKEFDFGRSGKNSCVGEKLNSVKGRGKVVDGLKPKDLVGIPWRVAFALQSDGWWLRQDIIWEKPNPMPESVTDRCTKNHEYVFLLAKNKDYYYDAEAIKEPNQSSYTGGNRIDRETPNIKGLRRCPDVYNPSGRNKRSVWTITTKPFKDSHFATFPLDLIRPMILAGTSERGVCPDCGKPWEKIVERDNPSKEFMEKDARVLASAPDSYSSRQCVKSLHRNTGGVYSNAKTLGWKASCKCNKDPIPALVLDPFCGSGTACLVAKKLNRHYIGFEINPEYVKMANNSIISNRDMQVMHTLKLVDKGLQKKLEWN